jgi:hypothetical protein
MRRSEMVNIIWDAINELEDGDYILQRIEAAGMMPPDTHQHLTFDYSWEPELTAADEKDDFAAIAEAMRQCGAK